MKLSLLLSNNINEFKTLLLEAARPPANFITKEISNTNFPGQYAKWVAVKLTKDFKDKLATSTSLNNPKLKNYIYDDVIVPQTENERKEFDELKRQAKAVFNTEWTNTYRQAVLSIRDWIVSSKPEDMNSFKSTLTNSAKGVLDQLNFTVASAASELWHKNLEETNENSEEGDTSDIVENKKIVLVFDDYYWIDNESNKCDSSNAVGCATDTNADTIYTLKKRGSQEPTISISTKESKLGNIYLQAKGKSNERPKEEHFKYIEALFKKINVIKYNGKDSYRSENDFKPEDITDPELKKTFEDQKNMGSGKLKLLLKDYTESDVKIDKDNELIVTYDKNFSPLGWLIDDSGSPYTRTELLTGEADTSNKEDFDIRDIWDDVRDAKVMDSQIDSEDFILDLYNSLVGIVYKTDEGEYKVVEPIENYYQEDEALKEIRYILDSSLELAEEEPDLEEIKRVLPQVKESNIQRAVEVANIFQNCIFDIKYENPLSMSMNMDNDYMDEKLRELGLEGYTHGGKIVISGDVDTIDNALDLDSIDSVADLKKSLASYIDDKDAQLRFDTYEPYMSDEMPYFINNLLGDLEKLPVLNYKLKDAYDHPDQLSFSDLNLKESYNRILKLAGVL